MKSSRLALLVATILLGVMFSGCKDESEAVLPAAAAPSSGASVTPSPSVPDAVAPPPVAAPTLTDPAAAASAPAAEVPSKDALETVTRAVQSFYVANNRAPQSLDELLTSGFLHKLPTPPAGKKYVYKPEVANISLENQ